MSGTLTSLERIIAKNPTSSLFARLADAYLQQGDVNRAIEVCRQGLRYRPSYVSGHVVLGKSYFSAGMFEEARRAFNKALHLDSHHVVAIWYLGQIDRAMRWDDLALRNFQKARDLDPLSQTLQKAIDDILASISSQMGQKLRDEVSGGNNLVNRWRGAEIRPQDRSDTEAVGSKIDRSAGEVETTGDETSKLQPPEPLPSAAAVDEPGPDAEKTEISRLFEEIEASAVPVEDQGMVDDHPVNRLGGEDQSGSEVDRSSSGVGQSNGSTEEGTVGVETMGVGTIEVGAMVDGMTGLGEGGGLRPSKSNTLGGKGRSGSGVGRSTGSTGEGTSRGDGMSKERLSTRGLTWEGVPITTATLAEIYAGQGLTAQAIAIFEKVVEREPGNVQARERLKALKAQHVANPSSQNLPPRHQGTKPSHTLF